MRASTALATALFLALGATSAFAQSATKIGQHNAWGTYSYQGKSGKVCYVLSVPTDKKPATLDHGDIYFFVSQRPGATPTLEPQFIASYDLQDKSTVQAKIDGKTFGMFTRGKSAWVKDPADEPNFIAAMKSGHDLQIAAKSGRGNPTSYVFSLKGISAALTSIAKCK